ncbi:MAG: hypothetical protein ABIA63_02130 [bacterium]
MGLDNLQKQFLEINAQENHGPHITCECGKRPMMFYMFRCLYCGLWFCQSCAGKHFGCKDDRRA